MRSPCRRPRPDTLYAVVGGSPGSAFRSTDGAATWSLVSNALAAPYLGDLLVDPADPATVYALAPDEILKSFDGGATWVPLPPGPAIQRLYFGREQPAVLYATVSGAGVSASTDAGASWQPANAGIADQTILDLAFDPVDPQKIYAASSGSSGTPGGLFVSTDHAQSWTPVDLGVPVNVSTAVAFDPRDASLVYAAAGPGAPRGGLLASADGGATWARREKGLSGYYNNAVAGHPSAGATAYCASGSRVYRTDDSGAGWALQATIDYPIDSLALDPTGNGTLYAGYGSSAANGVLKSVDGGMSWNPATQGISTSLLRHVEIGQTAPEHLLAATTDGIFGTVDGGGLWTPLLSGDARAAAIDPADPAILYAGLWSTTSPGDGLLRSPDGGATWNAPSGLPTAYPHVFDIAITRSDPTRVYAAFYGSGSGQGVYRSVDRGLSFAPAVAGLPDQFWALDIVGDPSRAATLYVTGQLAPAAVADGSGPTADVAEGTIVYRTTNGADSWMAVPGSLPVFSVFNFAVGADGRTLYASTQSGAFQFARSFLDVPDADPFWTAVDAAAMNGVTAGCGAGKFCPAAPTSRAGIAVFLLRGKNGAFYTPPPATGAVFGDVPAGAPAAAFIEALAATGSDGRMWRRRLLPGRVLDAGGDGRSPAQDGARQRVRPAARHRAPCSPTFRPTRSPPPGSNSSPPRVSPPAAARATSVRTRPFRAPRRRRSSCARSACPDPESVPLSV